MNDSAVRRARWLAPALLALGSLGCAAAWILLALASYRQSSWMAVLAAVDSALLLRLARMPAGNARMLLAVLGTAVAIAAANWGIIAAQVGRTMGLLPWESALKLGSDHAWTLAMLANAPTDLAWMVAALALAAWLGR